MAKKKDDCNCLKEANEALNEQGIELETAFQFNMQTGKATVAGPFLAVKWKDKPKRGETLPRFVCSYCPICGKKKESE